jgi:hypothetical protein
MADKELSITLRVRNFMQQGFVDAKNSLASFGTFAKTVGSNLMNIKSGFDMAGSAISFFASHMKRAFSEYAEAQKAEKNLTEALRLQGVQADIVAPKLIKYAEAMMRETGVSDDLTKARMASLLAYGVEATLIEEATKATVGLVRAGMGEEAAQKGVAAALNGSFEALTRFIPALRTASTEQEKARIVNDFISKQWELQKDDLKTLSGSFADLKQNIGEVYEELGKSIVQNGNLANSINSVNSQIKGLLDSGAISDYGNEIAGSIQEAINMAKQVAPYFEEISQASDKLMKTFGVSKLSLIGGPFATMASQAKALKKEIIDVANFVSGKPDTQDSSAQKAKEASAIKTTVWKDEDKKKSESQKKQELLDAMMVGVTRQKAKEETKIIADYWMQRSEIEKQGIEDAKRNRELAFSNELKRYEFIEDHEEAIKAKKAEIAESEYRDALRENDRILALQRKRYEDAKNLAQRRVADFIDESRKRKDEQKMEEGELKKWNRLQALQVGGGRLSTKDKQWENAFAQRELARIEADKLLPKILNGAQAQDLARQRDADLATIKLGQQLDQLLKQR